MRPIRFSTLLLPLAALVGCGGLGVKNADYTGHWSGTISNPDIATVGQFDMVVGDDGNITGIARQTTDLTSNPLVTVATAGITGHINESNNVDITTVFPTRTLHFTGVLNIEPSGHLAGFLTTTSTTQANIGTPTQVDLTKTSTNNGGNNGGAVSPFNGAFSGPTTGTVNAISQSGTLAAAISADGQLVGLLTVGSGAAVSVSGTVSNDGTTTATTTINGASAALAGTVSKPGSGHLIGSFTVTPSGSTGAAGTISIDLTPLP